MLGTLVIGGIATVAYAASYSFGERCSDNRECETKLCVNGYCTAKCTDDSGCSKYGSKCDTKSGTCNPKSGEGGDYNTDFGWEGSISVPCKEGQMYYPDIDKCCYGLDAKGKCIEDGRTWCKEYVANAKLEQGAGYQPDTNYLSVILECPKYEYIEIDEENCTCRCAGVETGAVFVAGEGVPERFEGCTCPEGSTYDYEDQWKCICDNTNEPYDLENGCEEPVAEITCVAGQYLPANSSTCTNCPAGKYCTGGTWVVSSADQGINGNVNAGYYSTGGCKVATPTSSSNYVSGGGCGVCASGYSTGGATVSTCTACTTGYAASGSAASNHDAANDCKATITLNKNGGSGAVTGSSSGTGDGSIQCSQGVACNFGSPSALVLYGYAFTGWGTSSSCTATTTSFTNPTGTYYACKVVRKGVYGSHAVKNFDNVYGYSDLVLGIDDNIFGGAGGYPSGYSALNFVGWCNGENPTTYHKPGDAILSDTADYTAMWCKTKLPTHSHLEMEGATCDSYMDAPKEGCLWKCDEGYYEREGACFAGSGIIECEPGWYLPAGYDTCQKCVDGNYCPGGSYAFNEEEQQGMTKCPENWTSNDAKTITDCYRTVSLNKNGGSGTIQGTSGATAASKICYYNTSCPFGNTSTLSQTGYTFTGGWETNNSCNGTTTSFTIVSTDAATPTYYACKNVVTNTVSFNANGGSGGQSANVTATYGSAMPTISTTAPTRTGYTFKGWYDNATYTSGVQYYTAAGASARNWDKTTNTTLYAGWQANTYTISYALNGGSYGSNHPTSGTYGSVVTINNPTKTGYTFGGWTITGMDSTTHYYGNANPPTSTTTGTSLSSSAVYFKNLRATSGTVTFTANWTSNQYTITLNDNGGSGGNGYVYTKYGVGGYTNSGRTLLMSATAHPVPIPTKVVSGVSYAFLGYYTSQIADNSNASVTSGRYIDSRGYATADGISHFQNITDNNMTLYARFSSDCSRVVWDNATYCGSSAGGPLLYLKTVAVYSSGCSGGTYTQQVRYYNDADSCMTSACISSGNFSNAITSISGAAVTSPKSHSTYYGHAVQYSGTTYPIMINPNGSFDTTVSNNEHGYTLYGTCRCDDGWQGSGCTNYVGMGCVTTSACTEGITVNLDDNGGTGGATVVYTKKNTGVYTNFTRATAMSTSANPVTTPTRADATFLGYFSNNNATGTQYISSNGKITTNGINAGKGYSASQHNNVTWYAGWCIKITLNANGGSGGTTTLYKKGGATGWYSDSSCSTSVSTLPTAPSLANSTYSGHYTATSNGTQYITAAGALNSSWAPTAPTTLYARYSCNTGYTASGSSCIAKCNKIILNNTRNNGTGGTTELYKYSGDVKWYSSKTNATTCATQVTSITKPTKTNATYKGHYTANAASGGTQYITNAGVLSTTWTVTGDTTLYAQYDCNANYRGSGTTIEGACTPNKYEITLDDGLNDTGASGSGATSVVATATQPVDPIRIYEKYADNWYTTASGNTVFTQLTTIPRLEVNPGEVESQRVFTGFYTNMDATGTQIIDGTGSIVSGTTTTYSSNSVAYAGWKECECIKGTNVDGCSAAGVNDQNKCIYNYTCAPGYNNGGVTSGQFTGGVGVYKNTSPNCSSLNSYVITYKAGSGGSGSDQTQNVTFNQTFTTKAANTFSKANANFAGWQASAGNYPNASTQYTYSNTSNITLTATWTCKSGYYLSGTACVSAPSNWTCPGGNGGVSACYRTVKLNKNGGSGSIQGVTGTTTPVDITCYYNVNCNFGSAAGLTQTGYTFAAGWAEGSSGTCSSTTTTFKVTSTDATVNYKACKSGKTYSCDAGKYLRASDATCVACPDGYWCPGVSNVTFDGTDKGKNACSGLAGVSPSGGTYKSVSPRDTNKTCTYKAPDKTITGCYSVTPQTVTYTGSAWPASTYSVTANKGYVIANNGTKDATCSACVAGKYQPTDGSTATSCTACATGSYNTGTGNYSCTACASGKTNSGTGNTSACTTACSNAAGVATWNTTTWSNSPTANTVSNLCSIATYNVYTVTLDSKYYASSTASGTAASSASSPTPIYVKYNTGWYSNSGASTAVSTVSVTQRCTQSGHSVVVQMAQVLRVVLRQ